MLLSSSLFDLRSTGRALRLIPMFKFNQLYIIEQYVAQDHLITEEVIQVLHALVMSDGRKRVKAPRVKMSLRMVEVGQ